MKSFLIKDWSRGIADFPDLKDLGAEYSNVITNFNLRPGMLAKRDRAENIVGCSLNASITDPIAIGEFNLNDERFLMIHQDSANPLKRYDYSSGTTYASSDSLGTDNWSGTANNQDAAKFTVINNTIRIAIGNTQDKFAMWYGQMSRERFNDASGASLDGWYLEDAMIIVPYGSYYTTSQNTGTPTNALEGKYFFRFTYEYDYFQEGWWEQYVFLSGLQQAGTSQIGASNVESITLNIKLPTSIPARVSGVNVYIAHSSVSTDNNPETAYYWGGKIDINEGTETNAGFETDSDWSASASDYAIAITLDKTSSATFPAGHNLNGHIFEEELYTRLNAVVRPRPPSGPANEFRVEGYKDDIWVNQRHFIISPKVGANLGYHPYDFDQVVLFSQIAQPDIFHHFDDYIDLSTKEGDKCKRIFSLFGDLLVLKEYNMFRIRFNNSGNSLDWSIQEHWQQIGCVAENSLAIGNGKAFWAGEKNIYMFDGNQVIPITKDKIGKSYRDELEASYSANSSYDEIYGVYDSKNDQYILNIVDSGDCVTFVYDVYKDSFRKYRFDGYIDDSNLYFPSFMTNGLTKDILVLKKKYGSGGSVAIFKLEAGGNDETNMATQAKSNWLSLNDNPQQDKRLIEVKIRYKNNGTNTIVKLYKDSSGSAAFTSASLDSSGLEQITYIRDSSGNNPSMSGKVFQHEIVENSPATPATTLEIYEIEYQYEMMGNR